MNDDILIAILIAVESAHAYSAFMPSVFTIGTFADSDEKIAVLRKGYFPATVFSLVLGYIASAVKKNYMPLAASAVTSVFMIAFYEHAIRMHSAVNKSKGANVLPFSGPVYG